MQDPIAFRTCPMVPGARKIVDHGEKTSFEMYVEPEAHFWEILYESKLMTIFQI